MPPHSLPHAGPVPVRVGAGLPPGVSAASARLRAEPRHRLRRQPALRVPVRAEAGGPRRRVVRPLRLAQVLQGVQPALLRGTVRRECKEGFRRRENTLENNIRKVIKLPFVFFRFTPLQ